MKNLFLTVFIYLWGIQLFSQGSDEEFNAYINREISESKIAGMGIAIITDDSILVTKGYGYADIQNKVPFTHNTVINIASISKTFISIAIMHAVENNLLDLDNNVNDILPFKLMNPYSPDRFITLRHLMSHTSGIQDDYTIYYGSYCYGGDSPTSLGEFLVDYLSLLGENYSKNNFTNTKPGEKFNYSNIGAGLAGYIVEIATGKPLNVFTREIIFKPLDMENTCWFLSEMDIAKHSKLYETRKFIKGWKEIPIYGLTTYPDGGVRTTINDLSNYLLCIMNNGSFKGNSIIQESSVLEMLTPDFSGSYAKFWQTGKGIGHGGGDPGVSTRMYFDPGKKLGIIIFINTGSYDNFEELEDKVYEYGSSLLSQINNSKK